MEIDWQATYLQAGRDVLGAMTEQEKARLVGVPFFDWPRTVLAAIDARANELAEQSNEPPPEVIEMFARDCRCCGCCRQAPCPGVMAGGMCDDFACVHEEEPSDWNDGDDDIPEVT